MKLLNINDKYLHAAASCIIEIILALTVARWYPWQRFLANVILFGGGKEIYDYMHPDEHDADWKDLVADAIGALIGEVIIAIIGNAVMA